MSREIKFRFRLELIIDSWGIYEKGDIDYFYISLLDEKNGLVRLPIDSQWKIVSCDEYTGLKDKNGLDIYEGDIVNSFKKTYEDSVSKNKVEFIEGCWKLICDGKKNIPLFLYKPKELEIIGNIYENPNLLIKNQ